MNAPRVPIAPFEEWAARLIERHGSTEAARRCQIDESYLRRISTGEYAESYGGGKVSLDFVDRVLIAEGSTLLQELYPAEDDTPERRHRGGAPRGKYRRMTDTQVRSAHILYTRSQISLARLGEMLWRRYGYSSPCTASSALQKAFTDLGLPRRPLVEAIAIRDRRLLATTTNGALRQPRCSGVRTQPPRKGQRCAKSSLPGSEFCWAHDPDRADERQAGLAAMRARQPARDPVPIEPFAQWVEQQAERLGSNARVARYLRRSTSTVGNILGRVSAVNGVRTRVFHIDRATVERHLATARAQGLDGVPTFDELYAGDRGMVVA